MRQNRKRSAAAARLRESEHDEYSVNVELGWIVVIVPLTVCIGFVGRVV
jgi:hypothetical protein